MPYDNEYNRKVASEVSYLNKKFVTHSDATGQGTIDYTQSANLSGGFINYLTGLGRMMIGSGGGVAEFKGAVANKKHCYEGDSSSESDEEKEGGTRLGHPKKQSNETGEFDELQGGAILGLQAETVVNGKKGKRVPKGKVNNLKAVKQSFGTLGTPADASKTREMVALASTPASNARLGIASKPVGSAIEGGKGGYAEGTFRDTGFGEVEGAKGSGKKRGRPKKQTEKAKEDEKLAMELKGVQDKVEPKKRGRKKKSKKSSKGSIEGGERKLLGMTYKGKGKSGRMLGGTTTNTKETLKSTPKATLSGPVPKAQMPSSTLSGFGKGGKAKRAEIVRKVMKEKGLKLIEASKYVKEHNLY